MSKRQGIMLCYPFEEKRLLKWEPPFIVQPKLDGERCRALCSGNEVTLLTSECNILQTVPHINNALRNLGNYEFDGELYCHGMGFEEIHSIVSSQRVSLHEDYKRIQFHIFDIVIAAPQHKRNVSLMFFNFSNPITLVPSYRAETLDDVMRIYDRILSRGYEGIIVRNINNQYKRSRSTGMMKFKPKKFDVYKIVDWKEEIDKNGNPKNRLGALICVGSDGNEFSVGSGLNDELREGLWKSRGYLPGKFVKVQYQHLSSGRKVPRFPVFVEIIDKNPEINPLLDI